jgi:hypothetical protein
MSLLRRNMGAMGLLLLWGTPACAQWASCSSGPAGSLCLPSGNVGIGTTSPAGASFVIQRAGGEIRIQGDATHALAMGGWDGTYQYITSIDLGNDLTPLTINANHTVVSSPYIHNYPLIVRNGVQKGDVPDNHYVGMQITTADSTDPLIGTLMLYPHDTDPSKRILAISAREGSTFRNIELMGAVGIGTPTPCAAGAPAGCALSVNGAIQAKEVVVNTGWSDYVFDPGYRLEPLSEVAAYVTENHHLPDIPSAQEVAEKGVSVGEMQSKLLAKIEELTLHVIDLDRKNAELTEQNREFAGEIQALKRSVAK